MRYLGVLLLTLSLEATTYTITPNNPQEFKKICKLARAGDTIYLRGGTYTEHFPKIKCKGDGGYIYIQSYPGEVATIRTPWHIKGNYLDISGLNFKGYNKDITYNQVIKQWWNPGKDIKQRGLLIEGHHINLHDNAIGMFPSNGVKFKGKSDYLKITLQAIEAGTYDFSATMSGGEGGTASPVVYTDSVDVAYTEVTADAVDDDFYQDGGSIFYGDVSENDTWCNVGVTTFNFRDPVNGTVISRGPMFQFTFDTPDQGSFMYDILCNGIVVDSAQAIIDNGDGGDGGDDGDDGH